MNEELLEQERLEWKRRIESEQHEPIECDHDPIPVLQSPKTFRCRLCGLEFETVED